MIKIHLLNGPLKMLIKHIAALVILTLVVLFGHEVLHTGLMLWMDLQAWLAHLLNDVFSDHGAGGWIKEVLAFLAVPLVFTFLPAGIYWCFRRHSMPHTKEIFWLLWVVQSVIFCLNSAFLAS